METECKKLKRISIGRYLYGGLIVLLAAAAGLSNRIVGWVFETWPHLSADELLYQLTAPVEGTNKSMIWDAVKYCVPMMILGLIVAVGIFVILRKKKPALFWPCMSAIGLACIIAIAIPLYNGWNRLELGDYFASLKRDSGLIDDNYVFPSSVDIEFPEEKRNLIYIFLESMETTYADQESGGAFSANYIPELTALAQSFEDFSGESQDLNGGFSMMYTSWTVAAMFAHTSGLPLKMPFEDGGIMETQDSFLPKVVTLGDILEEAGYNQTLLVGSDAIFGGRQQLFETHGNFTIHDYLYALDVGRLPQDYYEWWGHRDSKLFEFAKEELLELASKDAPFNLTMLTVDTHFEDGFVCDLCRDDFGDDQYANVLACSSRQVAEFVEWIQEQDFYENTTIVLVGDHTTMDADFCVDLEVPYDRRVYTAFINADVEVSDPTWQRLYTTFDMFPTTLASLGVEIEGNRLGLGSNLFSEERTLMEIYYFDQMRDGLIGNSELMNYFCESIDASKVGE